jgi:hypothetical protein
VSNGIIDVLGLCNLLLPVFSLDFVITFIHQITQGNFGLVQDAPSLSSLSCSAD